VFSDIAAYEVNRTFNLSGVDVPERLTGLAVSANFFSVLGVHPDVGRGFLPDEDVSGGPLRVILTHGFWIDHYGFSKMAAGQSIKLNEKSYDVVGAQPSRIFSIFRSNLRSVASAMQNPYFNDL